MTNKRKHRQVIYHTSAATVDKDQALALRAARKILQSSFTSSPPPKPLPSPIKRPNPRKKK